MRFEDSFFNGLGKIAVTEDWIRKKLLTGTISPRNLKRPLGRFGPVYQTPYDLVRDMVRAGVAPSNPEDPGFRERLLRQADARRGMAARLLRLRAKDPLAAHVALAKEKGEHLGIRLTDKIRLLRAMKDIAEGDADAISWFARGALAKAMGRRYAAEEAAQHFGRKSTY